MIEFVNEKCVHKEMNQENDKCPRCREVSDKPVMPFGTDFFFCSSPICEIVRFWDSGYYIATTEPIGTPNVQKIVSGMIKKRNP